MSSLPLSLSLSAIRTLKWKPENKFYLRLKKLTKIEEVFIEKKTGKLEKNKSSESRFRPKLTRKKSETPERFLSAKGFGQFLKKKFHQDPK